MGTYMITGSTGGIGGALAERLHERGHELILSGRSKDRLTALCEELPGSRPLLLDLADPSGLAELAKERGRWGWAPRFAGPANKQASLELLDGLIHCAGALALGNVAESGAADWITQLTVNVAAPAELTRLLLPALRAAGGHVIFVNSGSGLHTNPGWGAYSASKHGMRALAEALRAEEPEIRVTSVYPGRTATEMQRKVRTQEGGEYRPAEYMSPSTVAWVIMTALETPRDAVIRDINVRG